MSLESRMNHAPAERRRRLNAVALLPSAATLGNLLCGVLAGFFCLLAIGGFPLREFGPRLSELFPSWLAIACYCLIGAMIFDALDGRLARLARRTTEFGGQLDSVADIVSFGAAPGLLYLTLLLSYSDPANGHPSVIGKLEWRFGMVFALVYVSCAAIRLARYNVENVRDESGQKKFSGLPVPGAAAAITALVILHEDFARMDMPQWAAATRILLAPMLFGIGLLMVSRLDYVHVFNVYVRREQPPSHLIALVVLAGLMWWWAQIVFVLLAYTYVISGLVLNLLRWRRGQPPADAEDDEPEEVLADYN